MPKWICSTPWCDTWVFAPSVRPVHAVAPNPSMQARDPSCPKCQVPLEYTEDAIVAPIAPGIAPGSQVHKIGTIHEKLGILVGLHNNLIPIYCDYHQRKHVSHGLWPGSVPTNKPVFLPNLFHQGELTLCSKLATSVPWGRFIGKRGGTDVIFDCGRTVVGTDGEQEILVQGGAQIEKGETIITFHAYPVARNGSQASTYRSCEKDDRFLPLEV
ncbi:hypothetical protein MWU61_13245 [Loktanella sp. F6476L]|uniref:hypothetical protein n=1 Tax=Loktanella sp. F6476L TaxID=2926405 RepID=UPI001FF3E8FD|nr:hypothetical protein [Loktanella sp. F6476L]MCK0121512.1 hypothetical protein [Loktanella sp. F6476L]